MEEMPERMLRSWVCREAGMVPKRRSSCIVGGLTVEVRGSGEIRCECSR